jgi:hypothetical protein
MEMTRLSFHPIGVESPHELMNRIELYFNFLLWLSRKAKSNQLSFDGSSPHGSAGGKTAAGVRFSWPPMPLIALQAVSMGTHS